MKSTSSPRENTQPLDVLVVGGGPAGIMAAEAEAQAIMQVQTALADSLKLLNAAAPLSAQP